MIEQQVNYIIKCIQKLFAHELTSLEINANVIRTYNNKMQSDMTKTVWVTQCDSWYKNATGKVVNNWPNNATRYFFHMKEPDFNDFNMSAWVFARLSKMAVIQKQAVNRQQSLVLRHIARHLIDIS